MNILIVPYFEKKMKIPDLINQIIRNTMFLAIDDLLKNIL